MADTTEKTIAGCTVLLLDLYGQPHCQEPVVETLVAGCVHEHLDEDRCCARHASLLLEGDLLCAVCWRLGDRRVRVTSLARVLPSGERVRVELRVPCAPNTEGVGS